MSNQPDKPIYLIAPGDPVIEKYKPAFDAFGRDDMHTFTFTVDPEHVDTMQVAMLQEMIAALQHFPHRIDKWLFTVGFNFTQVAHSKLYYQKLDWKSNPKYYRWFCKMGTFPLTIFFLNDSDARFYSLAGDFLADGKATVQHEPGKKTSLVGFEGEELKTICERLFTACWMLHIYCHGSSYNPRTFIEALLAEYGLPIEYEQVRKKYKEDVKTGIKLRIVAEK